MNDIEKSLEDAKKQLAKGFTCAFCKDGRAYTAKGKGIKPLLDLVEGEYSLKNFSAADIIVGKAAAMLFALAGVCSVYGEVMSESGKAVLEDRGIIYSYGTLVQKIINRKGDGECPMEMAVKDVAEPEEALQRIKEKLTELMNNKA